ncbi:zinc-binding dehydrogenase [Klebsiella pneumoniae subsp. pneumoniae]|nr:zinc-binding dehydrogenase [Klebsiella pneumoniae subsp. pneumoniae]
MVGIGGLGHMGIELAHAMGAQVVAFATSESKRNAARALGADDVVVSRNDDEMAAHVKSFDFILNTPWRRRTILDGVHHAAETRWSP